MHSKYKKFFKYLYVVCASLFLVFMYRKASPEIFIFGGYTSLLMFVLIFPLIFGNEDYKKWINILIKIGLVATLMGVLIVLNGYLFLSYKHLYVDTERSICLAVSEPHLYQNIFTRKVSVFASDPCKGPGNYHPWYLRQIPWEDPRNPLSKFR